MSYAWTKIQVNKSYISLHVFEIRGPPCCGVVAKLCTANKYDQITMEL